MKNTCAEIPATRAYLISTAEMAMHHGGTVGGSRNQAGQALRTCNGHGACCVRVAVRDGEVAVEGLKESFSGTLGDRRDDRHG